MLYNLTRAVSLSAPSWPGPLPPSLSSPSHAGASGRESGAEVAQEVGHLSIGEAVAKGRHGAEFGMGRHRDAVEDHMKQVVGFAAAATLVLNARLGRAPNSAVPSASWHAAQAPA